MNDLKFAFRQLRKNPGFTAVAMLTLALGIGACTTTFSLVNAVLLQPLTFKEPERLVWIQNGTAARAGIRKALDWKTTPEPNECMAAANVLDWQKEASSFESITGFEAYFEYNRYLLSGHGTPQRLRGLTVSQNFLPTLGVSPLLGRNFVEEECQPKGQRAVMLSHSFWRKQFSGDPNVIGRNLTLNGKPTAIIGVLPAKSSLDTVFSPGTNEELLVPYALEGQDIHNGNSVFAIGRLKPGVTLTQAQEEMAVLSASILKAHPERAEHMHETGPELTLVNDHVRGTFRRAFSLLAMAVLFVWLIACINLSNLLLVRADARKQEFSMRTALGASRWRLLQQTMTESLLIAGGGCALGVLVSWFGVASLSKLPFPNVPMLQSASLDSRTLAATGIMACLSALICGALPAIQQWRRHPGSSLLESGTRGNTRRGGSLLRRTLVVSEIALACVLLVGAGLLTRSFVSVLKTDLGFETDQVYSWLISAGDHDNAEARDRYLHGLVQRISAVPGVASVGITDSAPMGMERRFRVQSKDETNPNKPATVSTVRVIDQQALQTMGTPLRKGRYFDDRDGRKAEKTILLSETLARDLWGERDPIGRTALVRNLDEEFTVIGVVADVAHGLEDGPQPDMYLHLRQTGVMGMNRPHLMVRAQGAQASLIADVRGALAQYDPTLPSNEFIPIKQIVDREIAPRELITSILSVFSTLALLLAAIGLYGLIAYSVGQRTREVGIRLAVGAKRIEVLWLIIREVLKMTAIGIAIGLVGAFFVTHLLQSQLHGITANDPVTFAITALLLGLVAMLAAWLPARRAANIDPTTALRAD